MATCAVAGGSKRGGDVVFHNNFKFNFHKFLTQGERWLCVAKNKCECKAYLKTQNDNITFDRGEHTHKPTFTKNEIAQAEIRAAVKMKAADDISSPLRKVKREGASERDVDPLAGPIDERMIDVLPSGSGTTCIVIKQEPTDEGTSESWAAPHSDERSNESDGGDVPVEIPLKNEIDPILGEVIPLDLEEDDLLYFRSLVPDLAKLTPELKDVFRLKVRNMLKELAIKC